MIGGKRGQISTEYLIVIGFITFILIGVLGVAFYYVGGIKDKIKDNQLDGFAQKIVSSAETVYYSGDPSKLTITAYMPSGVTDVEILSGEIAINMTTSTGLNIKSFKSNVPILGTLSTGEGVKKIVVTAYPSYAEIKEG